MSRIEADLLGTMELPDQVLYGIQTERARRHLSVSGRPGHPRIWISMLEVKRACAMANAAGGWLEAGVADALVSACLEMEADFPVDHFPLDALQGGAGTSTNMNINEVLAARASQLTGRPVHPLAHVNLHQSTVIPEMVIQAAYRVMGHDHAISLAAMSGELELNAFLPLIADSMLDELQLLERADLALARDCVDGIKANMMHCRHLMEQSRETVTALVPLIGHDRALELARIMRERRVDIRAAAEIAGFPDATELERQLDPARLCALGYSALPVTEG